MKVVAVSRYLLSLVFFAFLLKAGSLQAQNLIVNGGFENNPPPNLGNNLGYPIPPWILGPGNGSNVVAVNGGTTYGNSGPALDADPATPAGVRQHYLDINAGANDFYQSFTVPTCGAAAGQTRVATYSGWFSTRDNLPGAGGITIRAGAGLNGTVLGTPLNISLPTPVPNSRLAPWVQVSGTVTVTSGNTISYVVSMSNNVNFDQAFLSFNDVNCVTSALTLEKAWVGAVVGDGATLSLARSGTLIDTLVSTAGNANEVDVDATPALTFQGETLVLSETLNAANQGVYDATLTCTGGGTLSGNTLTVGASGAPIVCRYTNSRRPANLSITKTNTPGQNGNVDLPNDVLVKGTQTIYTISVRNSGPGPAHGATLTDPPAAGLACTAVTCGNALGGAVCPAVSVAALQSTGVVIQTLPANSSVDFNLTCTVL